MSFIKSIKTESIVVAIVAFALGFLIGSQISVTPPEGSLSASLINPAAETNKIMISEDNSVLVTSVIDGDTILLEDGMLVRYIGIDTPENSNENGEVSCFAKEAKERNQELVEGQRVLLEKDVSDVDDYGRLLRYVYVADPTDDEEVIFVNLVLAEEGFAFSTPFLPDVKNQEDIFKAEEVAKAGSLGLWEQCDYEE
jgi:micrococcal nuclease